MNKPQAIDKALQLITDTLEATAKDSQRLKANQEIRITGETNGAPIHIGKINMNQNIVSVQVQTNLLAIQGLLQSIRNGGLISDTLNMKELKHLAFCKAMDITHGNQSETAKLLGISTSYAHDMAKQAASTSRELKNANRIQRALDSANGDKHLAADILGCGLSTLHQNINKYGIEV